MANKIAGTISALLTIGFVYAGVQAHSMQIERVESVARYQQIECLAKNIYFEARNQSELGQRAVAWVTLNRVESDGYPNTICDVVWQRRQFSWTHDGRSDTPRNQEAYSEALRIAESVYNRFYNNAYSDPTSGAIMYHASYSSPYWRSAYERTVQIDDHIFYKES